MAARRTERRSLNTTRVFVEATGRRIQPFDDPIGDTPILDRPLSQWQAEAFADAGLTVTRALEPPCLVVPDTLFASSGALRAFVDGAAGGDAVLVLKHSAFARLTTPVQPGVREVDAGYRFEPVRFVSGRNEEPRPVVVDPHEQLIEVDLPRAALISRRTTMGVPRDFVMTMHHWMHILWANQIAGPYQAWTNPPRRTRLQALRALARGRFADTEAARRSLNTYGKGCDIHPTAVVEGSRLGDGVTVGPYAYVAFSYLGDGASVSLGGDIQFSVLGRKTYVAPYGLIHFSLYYPDTIAGFFGQLSITGSDAVTAGVRIQNPEAGEDVRVELDGVRYSTGLEFLGVAFGYRSQLGGGTYVQAGSAIPNDYLIISEIPGSLSRIPPGLEGRGPLSVVDGTLRPSRPAETDADGARPIGASGG